MMGDFDKKLEPIFSLSLSLFGGWGHSMGIWYNEYVIDDNSLERLSSTTTT
jgi:hypothetical protein